MPTPASSAISYSYTIGATTNTASTVVPVGVSSTGITAATAGRYSTGTSTSEGADVLLFNPSTGVSAVIGLTPSTEADYAKGSDANFTQNSVSSVTASGIVVGNVFSFYQSGGSAGFTSGSDVWEYDPTALTTKVISLQTTTASAAAGVYYTGSLGARNNNAVQTNSSGWVVGVSNRYNSAGTSIGQDAWLYNKTGTSMIGLTGAGFTSSDGLTSTNAPIGLSDTNVATGYAIPYSGSTQLGRQAWIYRGGNTTAVGLTGTAYSESSGTVGYAYSVPVKISATGYVAGTSNRYSGSTSLGQDAWYVNGNTADTSTATSGLANTIQIGLSPTTGYAGNSNYVYQVTSGTSTGKASSTVSAINAIGEVAGYSSRFTTTGTSLGQDSWVYVPADNKTYAIDLSTSSGYLANSTITYMADDGIAVGYYTLYSGASVVGTYAFYWDDKDDTAYDLGMTVSPSLSADGWAQLAKAVFVSSANGSIFGTGLLAGDSSMSQTAFMATAVPEPASLGLLGLGAAALVYRRRSTNARSL